MTNPEPIENEFPDLLKYLNYYWANKPKNLITDFSGVVAFYTGKESPYINVGRNAPCPCGSEKKYKRCCLN